MWRSPPITARAPNRNAPGKSRISIWVRRRSSRPEPWPNAAYVMAAADAAVAVAGFRDILPPRASLQDVLAQEAGMKRRELLALLGGAALLGPRATLAQAPGRV